MNENTQFIVIKHGVYVGEYLVGDGICQVARFARQIKEVRERQPVRLIGSTAPWARQSGEILMRELTIPVKDTYFDESLWLDGFHFPKWRDTKRLLEDNLLDNILLICITHLDLISFIAGFVQEKFGGKKVRFGIPNYYVNGWFVDKDGCRLFS